MSLDVSSPDARGTLESVVQPGKEQAVAKRARAILQTMDETEAARRAALESWQQRLAAILAKVEAIAAAPSLPGARRRAHDAEAEWRDVSSNPSFELDHRHGRSIWRARGRGACRHRRARAGGSGAPGDGRA
jgi:hypothetical protein